MNPFLHNVLQSHSANSLEVENNYLRQQISVISPRVVNLELQMGQLKGQANGFQVLLENYKILSDTVSGFMIANNRFNLHALVASE